MSFNYISPFKFPSSETDFLQNAWSVQIYAIGGMPFGPSANFNLEKMEKIEIVRKVSVRSNFSLSTSRMAYLNIFLAKWLW